MGQATRGTGLVAAGIGWGIAAGVALGTLLIAPAIDGSLGGESVTASEAGQGDSEAKSGELARANGRVDEANTLLAQHGDAIVSGVLDGVAVTMIRTASASEEDAAGVRWMANAAGAANSGGIRLTEKFFERDAADELSSVIANTLPAGATLSVDNLGPGTHAGESLAATLTTASDKDRALVLEALTQAGFIEVNGEVGAADVIVVVAADEFEGEGFTTQLVGDFAQGLASNARTVVAAQGAAPALDWVGSQGNVDTEAGRVHAVLLLAEEPAEGPAEEAAEE